MILPQKPLRKAQWIAGIFLTISFLILKPAQALYLNLDQDAYGIGMGEAVAAISGGTHSILWNPAGVTRATDPLVQLGLGYLPANSDFHLNTGVLVPLQDGTVFGLSQYSDFPKSPNSVTSYIGSVGIPLNSSRDFLMGFNIKYLALSTPMGADQVPGRGIGLDLGILYDLRNAQGTLASFALAVKDLDTDIRFNNSNEQTLPRAFVLGAAYEALTDTRLEMDYQIADQVLESSSLQNRLRIGAEHFLDQKTYSLRLGYEGLFNTDGSFSFGAGYHPSQPLEVDYAFRVSRDSGQFGHFLDFIYRFDHVFQAKGPTETASAPAEINIGSPSETTELTSTEGKPVSPVPLRKLNIRIEPPAFSPSGRQKTTVISFPEDWAADTARWVLIFQDSQQRDIRRIGGTGSLLPYLAWDGMDDKGKPAPEGTYRVVLKTFNDKNETLSEDFEKVEIISPRSRFGIQVENPYFSLRGHKKKRELLFTVEPGGSREVDHWDFEISEASSNKVVLAKKGKNRLPKTLLWDGKGMDHIRVGDGTYLCLLLAEDKAGNPLKTDALHVYVCNTPPELSLKGQDNWFDFKSKKQYRMALASADLAGFQDWKVELSGENLEVVRTFQGSGQPPTEVLWDGNTSEGQPADPGSLLRIAFSATDRAGNTSTSDPYFLQLEAGPGTAGEYMAISLASVYFADSTADLTDKGQKEIEKTVEAIRPYLNKCLLVVKGYTAPGEEGDRLSLSHQRAAAVEKHLRKILSFPPNTLYAVGYAERDPLKTESGPAPDEKQRRAVITLLTKPE